MSFSGLKRVSGFSLGDSANIAGKKKWLEFEMKLKKVGVILCLIYVSVAFCM